MANEKIAQAIQHRFTVYYGLCDKIITLATGLLAVSVTFRNSLLSSPTGAVSQTWLLVVAWVGLAASILCGLLAHYGGVVAINRAVAEMASGNTAIGRFGPLFDWCFRLMWFWITLALGAFVAFAICNTPL